MVLLIYCFIWNSCSPVQWPWLIKEHELKRYDTIALILWVTGITYLSGEENDWLALLNRIWLFFESLSIKQLIESLCRKYYSPKPLNIFCAQNHKFPAQRNLGILLNTLKVLTAQEQQNMLLDQPGALCKYYNTFWEVNSNRKFLI